MELTKEELQQIRDGARMGPRPMIPALLDTIAARDAEIEALRRELAISMRVCGNWREFPNAPNAEEAKDWQYALRAIADNKDLRGRMEALTKEWERSGAHSVLAVRRETLADCRDELLTALSETGKE